MRRSLSVPRWNGLGPSLAICCAICLIPSLLLAADPINPDQAALMVLSAGQRAYNEHNYQAASDRFREFLKQYAGRKEAAAAQYGLGMSLLELPDKNFTDLIAALTQASAAADFPDRALAMYHLGYAQRLMGNAEYALALTRPNEAPQHLQVAGQRFDEASRSFTAALPLLIAQAKVHPPAVAGTLSVESEWVARNSCDLAEMLIRTAKFKEAKAAIERFTLDPAVAKSRYLPLALYHLGYANFALRDYPSAGRALGQLAPFAQDFGIHARYMLARAHHLAGDRAEAAVDYKAVTAAYDEHKKSAQVELQNPAKLSPERKAALEALVNGPPPDYVVRTNFYTNVLASELGKYTDALAGFMAVVQQNPKPAYAPEAQLRAGFCQLQLKNYPETLRLLDPLKDHPLWSDQALWWMARAQIGSADPGNAPAYAQALNTSMDTLRRAAQKAAELTPKDPDAALRRGDILMDLGDAQQLAHQFPQAAATYQQILAEKINPQRAEEAMQREVSALHLAAQYRESDDLAAKFLDTYPKSTLAGEVLFRRAESAYLTAVAASAEPGRRKEDVDAMFREAIKRYQVVIDKYPEFASINVARQGLGNSYYRLGDYAKTVEALSTIPEFDRSGELSIASYLLADCTIRMMPVLADDALQAERVIEQATDAVKLLESFVNAQPKGVQTPDALLKLGYCHQRIGSLLADPLERKKEFDAARVAYERVTTEFNQSPVMPSVVFERAKCIAELGDANAAIAEFNRFQQEPFHSSPLAPMAMLRQSILMRSQNKAVEALALITRAREQFEVALYADKSRSDWVPMIQYEQGMAQKESGKLADARSTFEILAKQFPAHPQAASGAWRALQCRREDLTAQLALARKAVGNPSAKPEELAAAKRTIDSIFSNVKTLSDAVQAQSDLIGKTAPVSEARLRILYEMAWCQRMTAEAEIDAARDRMRRDALKRMQDRLAQGLPRGQTPSLLVVPDVDLQKVAVQPAENNARAQYRALIDAGADSPVANDARIELAEMLAARDENDAAIDLLLDVVEHTPPPAMAEKVKLQLASCYLGRHDPKAALAQFKPPAPSFNAGAGQQDAPAVPLPPSPTFTLQARYLSGEAYAQLADWPKAIEQLLAFRDQDPFRSAADVADRALYRLGQAYAQAGQWDQSRASYDALVQRFPQSPLTEDARFGSGWAFEKASQWDNAINTYTEVTHRTAAEVGARAQLQLGVCQLAAKRFPDAAKSLMVVPLTYDYPELTAAAQCEAARAFAEMKQNAEARKLLNRVVSDHPGSKWAEVAKERLGNVQ